MLVRLNMIHTRGDVQPAVCCTLLGFIFIIPNLFHLLLTTNKNKHYIWTLNCIFITFPALPADKNLSHGYSSFFVTAALSQLNM